MTLRLECQVPVVGLFFTGINKFFERFEGDFADVVFDSFGVEFGLLGGDADLDEEVDDGFVAGKTFLSESATGRGEFNGLSGDDGDKTIALESVESFCNGGLGDTKFRDEIGGSDEAAGFGIAESVYKFHIVFSDFGLVVFAGADKGIFMFCHLTYCTLS